jgi:hypothetical protein
MVRLSLRLNTALAMPLVRPLCQKPPSPITEIARFGASTVKARHRPCRGRSPSVGVADVERRQDREQVTADVGADVMRAEFPLRPASSR